MAKATLEFDLTDADDAREHLRCIKSLDMALAIWDINQKLHGRCMDRLYNMNKPNEYKTGYSEGIEHVMEAIRDVFAEYNINTDELVV